MFAFTIELLTGRYVATAYNDRDRVEWPVHPARLFSALVATWGEGSPLDDVGQRERAALEWLEQLPAPDVLADSLEMAGVRKVAPIFVPVNDVYQVADVDRAKLDEAESALDSITDAKARTKAQKDVEKLRAKHLVDTMKAIAAPAKFGKEPDAGLKVLPDHRPKQPRTFPCATPATPRVAFVWNKVDAPPAIAAVLATLCTRLTRIGHSSSLVHMEIATADSLASWRDGVARFRPDEQSGELVLRWVEPGQVTRLCRAYDRHRETEPRVLPARLVPYTSRPEGVTWPRPRQAFSDELVVFACVRGGSVARLPITSTAGISRQFRRALMHHAGTPTPEIISGHRADGTPSQTPHLAVLPLPIVSGPHPSGAIAGIALALPHDCSPDARRAVMTTIGAYERAQRSTSTSDTPEIPLHLGESGTLMLQRVAWNDGSWTLTPWSWCRPSRRWATATPIALDRNPGDLVSENPQTREAAFAAARETVIAALEQMQLPAPNAVDIVRSCVLPGTVKPRDYPRFPSQPDRAQRVLVHARIEFEQLVAGPVIIGAGRYQGLGLCLPVDDTNEAR